MHTTHSVWQPVNTKLHLYEYSASPRHQAKTCRPILMLHSALSGLSSWEPMAEYFAAYGLEKLYALKISDLQRGVATEDSVEQVHAAIEFLLKQRHPKDGSVVVIGHGAGGLLGYRFWQRLQSTAHIEYLFMIATPHNTTIFPLLTEETVRNLNPKADPTVTQSLPVDFTKIRVQRPYSDTVLVNIMGHQVGPDWYGVLRGSRSTSHFDRIVTHDVGEVYDGLVQGLRLPEAINLIVTMRQQFDHRSLNKDKRVYDAILACLRGEYYQVKLRLVGLRLYGVDENRLAGPIAFEINGNRMPPDSIFQGIPERLYLFEESVPPLCTLHYEIGTVSSTITLHLKDLSNQRGKRRRMYTRLYVPLRHDNSISHTMQDSEGSDFIWRITCTRMPRVLDDPSIPEIKPARSKGI